MAHQSGRDRYLSLSEINQMVAAPDSERDRLLLLLFAQTGGRIEEVLRLRVCDVLVEDQALRLTNLKRRAGQEATKLVAVAPETLARIDAYVTTMGLRGVDWLFPGRRPGTHLSQRRARDIVYAAARRCMVLRPRLRSATLGPAWPHLFRHSLAIHWVRAGVDLVTVAHQLGHSQIANTVAYLGLDVSDQRSAAARIPLGVR